MQHIIEITDGVPRHPLYRMNHPVNLAIASGEQVAIVGANGSGKSRLVDIITGRYPLLLNEVRYDFSPSPLKLVSENIKYITFRDSYGDSDGSYYYQQRWNQHDIDEKTPTAGQMLEEAFTAAENTTGYGMDEEGKRQMHERRTMLRDKLYEMFHLSTLLDKYIITLSSGELRKFQLTKTLLSGPRLLIMDNPFIGLDAQTREQLAGLLQTLIRETDLQTILVLSKTDDIPEFITHVIPVEHLDILPKVPRTEYIGQRPRIPVRVLEEGKAARILTLPEKENRLTTTDTEGCMLRFNHVSIRYGQRTILKDLDDGEAKREMGFGRRKRCREIHPPQSGMCRQSAKLRLRHRTVRTETRFGREHLGHQTAYRLRQPGDAPRIPERPSGHRHRSQRTERLRRALRTSSSGTASRLRMVDGHFRHRRTERPYFPETLQWRATALSAGPRVRQRPRAAYLG